MGVTVRETFSLSCSDCGHSASFGDKGFADRDAAQHEREHDRMRSMAQALRGLVFDTADESYFTFDAAVEVARNDGWGFITWNGWVYAVRDANLNNRLCLAKDVI